jgi:hypothetical protein
VNVRLQVGPRGEIAGGTERRIALGRGLIAVLRALGAYSLDGCDGPA